VCVCVLDWKPHQTKQLVFKKCKVLLIVHDKVYQGIKCLKR